MVVVADNDIIQLKCSESIITCQICMEIFDSPRILPCQHNFCKICIISLIKKHCLHTDGRTNGDTFPCPICRKECKIRQKGKFSIEKHLKGFPENLLLKSLLESVEDAAETKKENAELELDPCDEDISGLFLPYADVKFTKSVLLKYAYFMNVVQYIMSTIMSDQLFTDRTIFSKLGKAELTSLLYDVCLAPVGEFRNQTKYSFLAFKNCQRLSSILNSIRRSESKICNRLRSSGTLGLNWRNVTDMTDAQTQTDESKSCRIVLWILKALLKIVEHFVIESGINNISPFNNNTMASGFVVIIRVCHSFLVLWYLLEFTATTIWMCYWTCFVIIILCICFSRNRHCFRELTFPAAITHVASCSWAFTRMIIRNYLFVCAVKAIFTHLDFWPIGKLLLIELVESIIFYCLLFLVIFFSK